jgi:hypothetical protein
MKYDKKKLLEIFEATKDKGYSSFVAEAKKMGVNEKSAVGTFYRWKRKQPIVGSGSEGVSQEPKSPVNDAPTGGTVTGITTISPNQVKVDNAPTLDEGATLRDKYKKMYEEIGVIDQPGTSDSGTSGTQQEPSSQTSFEPKKFNVKIGELFYQVGVALNDGLIWNERHLRDDEKNFIHETSTDIETTFNPADLEREDAPMINYALAAFAIPLMSRIDLIPKKIDQIREFFSGFGKNATDIRRPSPAAEPQTTGIGKYQTATEAPTINGIDAAVWNNASEQQREWMQNDMNKGFVVSPNYNAGGNLDYEAYRDLKVIRNPGDTWSRNM